MNRKGKNIFLKISQKTAHNLLTRFYESGIMLSFLPTPTGKLEEVGVFV